MRATHPHDDEVMAQAAKDRRTVVLRNNQKAMLISWGNRGDDTKCRVQFRTGSARTLWKAEVKRLEEAQ